MIFPSRVPPGGIISAGMSVQDISVPTVDVNGDPVLVLSIEPRASAINVTLNNTEGIYNSSLTIGTIINTGGSGESVYAGGVASGTVLVNGKLEAGNGLAAFDGATVVSSINDGGFETLSGTATDSASMVTNSGELIATAGATVLSAMIGKGSDLVLWDASSNDVTVTGAGSIELVGGEAGGGTATRTTVKDGGSLVLLYRQWARVLSGERPHRPDR